MKGIKDTIDVSGSAITKIGSMSWKQVLTFFVVILIILGSVGFVSYIYAGRAANEATNEAIKTQLETQQKIHDYEMSMRLQNSSALNNLVIQLMYETNSNRCILYFSLFAKSGRM